MPVIRPISDLANNMEHLSEMCHREAQPIFLTKNGKGDLVVMSQVYYERLRSLLDLYQQLGEAEELDAAGEEGISHQEMMNRLRRKLHE